MSKCCEDEDHIYWNHIPNKSFFKPLIGNFYEDMAIPRKFVANFQEELSDYIELINQSGRAWPIKLEKANEDIYFCEGWEQFLQDNDLQLADLLVFCYAGNSCFKVYMFDKNECEKESSKHGKQGIEMECSMEGSRDSGDQNSEHYSSSRTCGTSRSTYQMEFRSKRRHVAETERKHAIALANEHQTTNPSFICVMKPTNVYKLFNLTIPCEFAGKLFPDGKAIPRKFAVPQEKRTITLFVDAKVKAKAWPVSVLFRKYSTCFAGKWWRFVKDNNLEEGDVCVFELINPRQLIMKVHIFPVVKEIVPTIRL